MSRSPRALTTGARKFARDLFTDVRGKRAKRLVMEFSDEHKLVGPGLCEGAVASRFAEVFLGRRLNDTEMRLMIAAMKRSARPAALVGRRHGATAGGAR